MRQKRSFECWPRLDRGGAPPYRGLHRLLLMQRVKGRPNDRGSHLGRGERVLKSVVARAAQGLLAACLVLPACGCTPLTSDDATGEVQELSCEMSIDESETLSADYRSVLGAVALPTADIRTEVLEPVWWGDQAPLSYFAKFGLWTHPGSEFTLRVQHSPEIALMGWGAGEHASYSTLRSSGCDGSGWRVYAGGLWVAEPMCVELQVETPESSEVVSVEVGADC